MAVLNHLRHQLFWLLDSAKGGKVKSQHKEIKQVINQPNSPNSLKTKATHLSKLLDHAKATTPYYKELKEVNSISDFPVIKKTIIQNNFEQFQSSLYIDKNNFRVSTSGSTGVPFFLFQNQGKRNRNHADVIYFFNESHFNIGNRLYELEVWRSHNKKGQLKSYIQNIVQFDISKLTDDRINEFLSLLKKDRKTNKTLLGFASAFEMISQYLEKQNLILYDLNVSAVIANSEYLTPYTKKTLAKYLNTTVLSRYSSEEIGIIAQQTMNSPNKFVINHASYYVELLSFDTNESVMPGEFGRIVVTDLFNYAMPIIRYDTGDIAKFGLDENGRMIFEQIEGRKMDLIYDTNGVIISSFVVYTKFYKYYHLLKQYQFIQQGEKEYEVKLNLHGNKFEFENKLIEDIKSDFGEDAKITISYVDEIPPLSSGKRRKVVNNYKKI